MGEEKIGTAKLGLSLPPETQTPPLAEAKPPVDTGPKERSFTLDKKGKS